MSSKYDSYSLKELKEELKKRNAKLSGRKKELVERLEAYDRNFNFGQNEVICGDYNIDTPEAANYKDVNSETKFICFNEKHIKTYLSQFEKELGDPSKRLYEEQFLKYMRTANIDGTYYVRSGCKPEMTKSGVYIVDVVIEHDGTVSECQCECAVGMGPHAHCKHVCTVLFACTRLSARDNVVTEQTCTQRLQTFHHTKRYTGSPLKARDLRIPGADEATNVNFDPRPLAYRQDSAYYDYFRNTCLNYNMQGLSQMPIFQLFEPANALAVAHDHDYLKFCPEDNFLRALKVTAIEQLDINQIEAKTTGQSKNKFWHQERVKRIHSSHFGRICKATVRTDFKKLATSLTTPIQLKVPAVLHGQQYEDVALEKYMTITENIVKKCGIFVSVDHSFLASSPDGIVNEDLLVEVKCPYSAKNKLISPETVPYVQESDGTLHVDKTHDYFYQVQGQLLCSNRNECDFIIFTFKDTKIIRIKRDDIFIKSMLEKLIDFFNSYFKDVLLEKYFYHTFS